MEQAIGEFLKIDENSGKGHKSTVLELFKPALQYIIANKEVGVI
ncbi:MAG: hypothetical protein ACI808_003166 [Paraglaciecola sp.]|jgi:hypothetical protein